MPHRRGDEQLRGAGTAPLGVLARETHLILRALDLQGMHKGAADGLDRRLGLPMKSALVNVRRWTDLDPGNQVIRLRRTSGTVRLEVTCRSRHAWGQTAALKHANRNEEPLAEQEAATEIVTLVLFLSAAVLGEAGRSPRWQVIAFAAAVAFGSTVGLPFALILAGLPCIGIGCVVERVRQEYIVR
jgi:hypothetical protein